MLHSSGEQSSSANFQWPDSLICAKDDLISTGLNLYSIITVTIGGRSPRMSTGSTPFGSALGTAHAKIRTNHSLHALGLKSRRHWPIQLSTCSGTDCLLFTLGLFLNKVGLLNDEFAFLIFLIVLVRLPLQKINKLLAPPLSGSNRNVDAKS